MILSNFTVCDSNNMGFTINILGEKFEIKAWIKFYFFKKY